MNAMVKPINVLCDVVEFVARVAGRFGFWDIASRLYCGLCVRRDISSDRVRDAVVRSRNPRRWLDFLRTNIDRRRVHVHEAAILIALNLGLTKTAEELAQFKGPAVSARLQALRTFLGDEGGLKCKSKELIEVGRSIGQDAKADTVILVCLSAGYIRVAEQWLIGYRENAIGTLCFLCIDAGAEEFAKRNGIAYRSLFRGSTKALIQGFEGFSRIPSGVMDLVWLARTYVSFGVALAGKHIIHSDVDAFWMRDLAPLLHDIKNADLAVQQDFSIPLDVCRRWGFILCMGFYYIRNTPGSVAFMEALARETERYLDDQVAINMLLLGEQVMWSKREHTLSGVTKRGLRVYPFGRLDVSRDVAYGRFVRHVIITADVLERVRAQMSRRVHAL